MPEAPDESFDLGRYFSLLLRYWWLMALGMVVGAVLVWFWASRGPTLYKATTTIVVQESSGASSGAGGFSLSAQSAETYRQLVTTRPILEAAASQLGHGETAASLANQVVVSTVANTQFLTIAATEQDPQLAADVANTVASTFITQTRNQRLADIARFEQAAQAQGVQDVGSLAAAQLSAVDSLSTVESAMPPGAPISHHATRYAVIGAILGLMAAGTLILIIERLWDVVRDKDRFSSLFDLPVLAVVPRIKSGFDPYVARSGDRGLQEAIRFLRTNLQFVPSDRELKALLITSVEEDAGKTTVAAYLAKAAADTGQRVIVIEADMRKPGLSEPLLGVQARSGLSNFLADRKLVIDDVLEPETRGGFAVLPAGPHPPNPAELLNTSRFTELLEQARDKADLILIDAPPALAVADASIMAARTDGALVVVDATRTRARSLRSTFEALEGVRSYIVGAVLNKYKPSRFGYDYGYYYSYYYYDDGVATNGVAANGANGHAPALEPKGLGRVFKRVTARK